MEKNSFKTNKPRDYGPPPNKVIYFVVAHLIRFILKPFFKVKWTVSPDVRNLKPPFVILGNHPSYLDPFLMAGALYPFKINFLAAATFFRNKKIEPLLYLGGVIPKTQFRADPVSIKSMFKVIKRGGILGIFPEGARSTDGGPLTIEDSITKFIRKIGQPVVTVVSNGSYLSWPRWSESSFRRGQINIDVKLLFSKEDIANLTQDELHMKTIHSLEFNDYEWQDKNMLEFHSKAPAKGLHNILHRCPLCLKNWVMATTETSIYCKSCNNKGLMNKYGFISKADEGSVVFRTARDWNVWQFNQLADAVKSQDYFISDEATLFISEREAPYEYSVEGVIRLDKNGFSYHPFSKVVNISTESTGFTSTFESSLEDDILNERNDDESPQKDYMLNIRNVDASSLEDDILNERNVDESLNENKCDKSLNEGKDGESLRESKGVESLNESKVGDSLNDKIGLSKTNTKEFPLAGILGISSDYGENFEIVSDQFTYRFILRNGQKAISFAHSLEHLRKIYLN